ncbi:JMJ25 [Scenedesmus sp. PABB004]|nr:JMJ25 [Scenedesmus sp. PABB004]
MTTELPYKAEGDGGAIAVASPPAGAPAAAPPPAPLRAASIPVEGGAAPRKPRTSATGSAQAGGRAPAPRAAPAADVEEPTAGEQGQAAAAPQRAVELRVDLGQLVLEALVAPGTTPQQLQVAMATAEASARAAGTAAAAAAAQAVLGALAPAGGGQDQAGGALQAALQAAACRGGSDCERKQLARARGTSSARGTGRSGHTPAATQPGAPAAAGGAAAAAARRAPRRAAAAEAAKRRRGATDDDEESEEDRAGRRGRCRRGADEGAGSKQQAKGQGGKQRAARSAAVQRAPAAKQAVAATPAAQAAQGEQGEPLAADPEPAPAAAPAAAAVPAAPPPAAAAGAGASAGELALPEHAVPGFPPNALTAPDAELAAAEAGLPRLPPGAGQLRQSTAGGSFAANVDCADFCEGQQTGHHAKLFRRRADGEWEQLTASCHDCQYQHVRWRCPAPGHGQRSASFCNRCLLSRYRHTSLPVADLHVACPLCRGMCTCKACLRQGEHAGRLPTGEWGGPELARYGRYTLALLGPPLAAWLDAQADEAGAAGFARLEDVPVDGLATQERSNCDRCATNLVGMSAHCPDCGWDLCGSCLKDLRQHGLSAAADQRGAPAADAADAAGGGAPTWTCCNPTCSSTAPRGDAAAAPGGLAAEPGATQQPPAGAAGGAALPTDERGGALWCQPGAAALVARVILPADLLDGAEQGTAEEEEEEVEEAEAAVEEGGGTGADGEHGGAQQPRSGSGRAVLAKLRELAEPYKGVTPADAKARLTLADCPLLPAGAEVPRGAGGEALTLDVLRGERWWEALPAAVRDVWRRRAGSATWLFTPAVEDLELPAPDGAGGGAGDDDGAGGLPRHERVLLARCVWWARWLVGDPVVVRGAKGRVPWDPSTMLRAVREVGEAEDRVTVIDCADFHVAPGVRPTAFFKGYSAGFWPGRRDARRDAGPPPDGGAPGGAGASGGAGPGPRPAMLKVKDWPPGNDFGRELPRHMMDFIERLPLRSYSDPRRGWGPLNLAGALRARDNPTDLGPKCYLAYGRHAPAPPGGEGDSATKLHLDMTDAVNLLVDTHPGGDALWRARAAAAAAGAGGEPGAGDGPPPRPLVVVRCGDAEADAPGFGGAGAVWDIVRRGHVPELCAFLAAAAGEFTHMGGPVDGAALSGGGAAGAVMSQAFMLAAPHRAALAAGGVAVLTFEQHADEAVFIPGGCPHQVRNLASCCKVAVDFVSPENLATCLEQRGRLRKLDLARGQQLQAPPTEREYAEKLQSQLILLRGALAAAGLAAQPQVRPAREPELPTAAMAAQRRVTGARRATERGQARRGADDGREGGGGSDAGDKQAAPPPGRRSRPAGAQAGGQGGDGAQRKRSRSGVARKRPPPKECGGDAGGAQPDQAAKETGAGSAEAGAEAGGDAGGDAGGETGGAALQGRGGTA